MILHTGEALIDFIPVVDSHGNSAYRPAPGGSPYNSAIASSRLGVHSAFLGRVSRDFFGDQLLENLAENEVDTSLVTRSDQPSTLAFVKKTEAGEARYAFFVTDAADRGLTRGDVPKPVPEDAQCILFGSISLIGDPAGETILSLVEQETDRLVTSFDPNVRTVLIEDEHTYRNRLERACRAAGIIKISDEDLAWFRPQSTYEAAAEELLSSGSTRLVVVTKGAEGAFARADTASAEVSAVPVAVSDTVGAGDAFHSAVLVWLSKHQKLSLRGLETLDKADLEAMLGFAVQVAAKTCTRAGADPPREGEVEM
ncbi:MAG: carbohydrate kinase family protein [Spirochaetota bacterium]